MQCKRNEQLLFYVFVFFHQPERLSFVESFPIKQQSEPKLSWEQLWSYVSAFIESKTNQKKL